VTAPGAAAARALRHREWHWCRRKNGFCDLPKWRLVASRLKLPVFAVVAFVNRLEEFANDAGNKGFARGEVSHFSPDEFAVALGMSEDDAARIFAALEENDIAWIVDGHVADFYDRNRDKEDDTAALRQRRRTARRKVLVCLAELFRGGLVAAAVRAEIENRLRLIGDHELFALRAELVLALAAGTPITRESRRDAVTITAENSTPDSSRLPDSCGGNAAGGAAALSGGQWGEGRAEAATDPQAEANVWLASDGVRIVTEQLQENRTLASTKIARWRDQELGGDAAALMRIIQGAETAGYFGLRFLNLIVDGIRDAKRRAAAQAELPIPPVLASERKLA
jgi:hypothetical protein